MTAGDLRTCRECGEVFTAFQPGRRECVTCWMAHPDRDDPVERQKSQARLLVEALKRKRREP